MSRPGKRLNQEPFPWMWIPLLRVREKENMIKGKAKVSPKVKTKERVSLRLGQSIHTTRVLGTISLGINRTPMTPRAKEKARKVKTKEKVKVIKVKVVKLPMLSLMLGLKSNLQQLHELATHGMDDPDKWDKDNIGHLRSDRRREYEKKKPSRRSDSPAWVHDKHPMSEEESVASGQDYLTDLANRLDRLKNEPEVRQKLNQVLMDAYEAKYNEKIEVEPKEDEETEGFGDEEFKDRPKNDEKPYWETHPGEIMPFKVLHESTNLDIPVDYFFFG